MLDDYAQYLPLSLRQVFYRLIGAYGYDKSDAAYASLSEKLNRARRAGVIEWDVIRDDRGEYDISGLGYDSADDFLRTLRYEAEDFNLDHQLGQSCLPALPPADAASLPKHLEAQAQC